MNEQQLSFDLTEGGLDFAPVDESKLATLQEKFEAFHRANPWVYDELVSMTEDWAKRGHKKIGIGMLFELLRWMHGMRTQDPTSSFKLNNNHRSRYVRLIAESRPDLASMFELRELTSD